MTEETVPLEGYQYIECRDLRHAWTVLGWYPGTDGDMRRRCSCFRCGTIRVETIEGWVTRRVYYYPEGYHLDHRPSRGEILAEALGRATTYADEATMLKANRRPRRLRSA
jgi:hypothetical protein